MTIRRFEEKDARAVSELIAVTMRTTNAADYSAEYIEETLAHLKPEDILRSAGGRHLYVVEQEGRVVGCGAIGSYWGIEGESSLFTIFVHPDCQGKGIGQRIIETLEGDEFARHSRRIEIPASITAVPFYQKMGYAFKNGVTEPDDEGLLRLEKFL